MFEPLLQLPSPFTFRFNVLFRFLLQVFCQAVQRNVGSVIHVTIFVREKHFGLIDIGHLEMEGDTATGRKEQASGDESLPSMRLLSVVSVQVSCH